MRVSEYAMASGVKVSCSRDPKTRNNIKRLAYDEEQRATNPEFSRPQPCNKSGELVSYVCAKEHDCEAHIRLKKFPNKRWYFTHAVAHSCTSEVADGQTFERNKEKSQVKAANDALEAKAEKLRATTKANKTKTAKDKQSQKYAADKFDSCLELVTDDSFKKLVDDATTVKACATRVTGTQPVVSALPTPAVAATYVQHLWSEGEETPKPKEVKAALSVALPHGMDRCFSTDYIRSVMEHSRRSRRHPHGVTSL